MELLNASTPPQEDLIPLKLPDIRLDLEVIPFQFRERLQATVSRGMGMVVDSPDSLKLAVENLNAVSKSIKVIEERVIALRRPILAAADKVSADGKEGLAEARQLKATQTARIEQYHASVEQERQRQIALQQAIEREAEAKRRAAEEEQRKAAEKARLEAEQAQLKADRLKWEADERERRAAADLAKAQAGNDEASLTKATKTLEKTQTVDLAAQQAQAEADEARRKAEEVAAAPVVTIETSRVDAPIPKAAVTKGLAMKTVWEIQNIDKAKLPLTYLEPDEAKIRKALAMDIVIPGVTATKRMAAQASGRGLK